MKIPCNDYSRCADPRTQCRGLTNSHQEMFDIVVYVPLSIRMPLGQYFINLASKNGTCWRYHKYNRDWKAGIVARKVSKLKVITNLFSSSKIKYWWQHPHCALLLLDLLHSNFPIYQTPAQQPWFLCRVDSLTWGVSAEATLMGAHKLLYMQLLLALEEQRMITLWHWPVGTTVLRTNFLPSNH